MCIIQNGYKKYFCTLILSIRRWEDVVHYMYNANIYTLLTHVLTRAIVKL